MMMRDLAYLKLLAKEYPTVKEATSEIVNLTAICSLPKGTEYFSAICTGNMRHSYTCCGLHPVSPGRKSGRPSAT